MSLLLVFPSYRMFSQASCTPSLPAKSSEDRQSGQEQLEPSLERPSGQWGGHYTVRTGVGSVPGRLGADLLWQSQAVQVQPSLCARLTRAVQTESLQWSWMEVTKMSSIVLCMCQYLQCYIMCKCNLHVRCQSVAKIWYVHWTLRHGVVVQCNLVDHP